MARKPRPYFTLIAIDGTPGCPWSIEFGDYDRETVAAELDDYVDGQGFKRRELRIVETPDDGQHTINDAVAAINRKAGLYSEAPGALC